jgi:tetratricopeptide (TPR) repeat protein
MRKRTPHIIIVIFVLVLALLTGACVSAAASAEEYYSLGMAFYELGRYEEAELWLNRAAAQDRTMMASEYQLGRIAFETGRYEEAARHFEGILERDPDNVLALKAAAYARIRTGNLEKAEAYYERVLALVPESADLGYNYALVLYALGKPLAAEDLLLRYQQALEGNRDALLLLARVRGAQGKVEAVDSYAVWLEGGQDLRVRVEYAGVLEQGGFYVRALEEYRQVLAALPSGGGAGEPSALALHFAIARVLLTADPTGGEWQEELRHAVAGGYTDTAMQSHDCIELLLEIPGLSVELQEEIRRIASEPVVEPDAGEGALEGEG